MSGELIFVTNESLTCNNHHDVSISSICLKEAGVFWRLKLVSIPESDRYSNLENNSEGGLKFMKFSVFITA